MRGTTGVILQHHQILRLPRKVTVMTDPCHIWNVIYNARNNRWHPPTSPSTAPATQNDCHDWSSSHMKRYLQCAEQQMASSNITEYCACHANGFLKLSQKFLENSWNVVYNARPIRAGSENDPSRIRPWNRPSATRLASEVTFRARHKHYTEKYNISRSGYHSKFHRILRLPRKVTVQHHQILRLHATQSDCHDWSLSHIKRYLQCAEQQMASSNITEYCACHANWLETFTKISRKQLKRHLQCATDPSRIRPWSENETVTPQPASQARLLFTPTTSILYWKVQHFALRAIMPNFTEYCACHEKWQFNITKYCACHAKWLSCLILVTYETLFTMRGTTDGILQHHRILRLPRKMTVMTDPRHIWNVIYNARHNRWHPPTSPNTAPATQNDCHDWSSSHMKRYLQRAEQQMASSNITEYCACHANWLLKFLTKISRKQLKRHLQCATDPSRIRPWSEQDPRMKPSLRNPPRKRGYFSRPPRAFCIEKYNVLRSGYHSKFHRILRLPRKVTVQHHQILRLPRKVTLERDQIMHLPRKVTLELHQTVHLPRKVTLRYSTLLFSSLLYYSLLFSYESNLRRIYSIANLFSCESNLLRISSQTNLISYESNLNLLYSSQANLFSHESNLLRISSHLRISSQTNLISYESLLKRISAHTNLISYESLLKRI